MKHIKNFRPLVLAAILVVTSAPKRFLTASISSRAVAGRQLMPLTSCRSTETLSLSSASVVLSRRAA